MIQLFNYFLL